MSPATEKNLIHNALGEEIAERGVEEIEAPDTLPGKRGPGGGDDDSKYRVILYNDDYHGQDEVTAQIHKATGYTWEKCYAIMVEAHARGRAICYRGERARCHQVTKVLREIHLQCEVDCD
jgi:ATP-dependent Clp protease adapter protein ClpS